MTLGLVHPLSLYFLICKVGTKVSSHFAPSRAVIKIKCECECRTKDELYAGQLSSALILVPTSHLRIKASVGPFAAAFPPFRRNHTLG